MKIKDNLNLINEIVYETETPIKESIFDKIDLNDDRILKESVKNSDLITFESLNTGRIIQYKLIDFVKVNDPKRKLDNVFKKFQNETFRFDYEFVEDGRKIFFDDKDEFYKFILERISENLRTPLEQLLSSKEKTFNSLYELNEMQCAGDGGSSSIEATAPEHTIEIINGDEKKILKESQDTFPDEDKGENSNIGPFYNKFNESKLQEYDEAYGPDGFEEREWEPDYEDENKQIFGQMADEISSKINADFDEIFDIIYYSENAEEAATRICNEYNLTKENCDFVFEIFGLENEDISKEQEELDDFEDDLYEMGDLGPDHLDESLDESIEKEIVHCDDCDKEFVIPDGGNYDEYSNILLCNNCLAKAEDARQAYYETYYDDMDFYPDSFWERKDLDESNINERLALRKQLNENIFEAIDNKKLKEEIENKNSPLNLTRYQLQTWTNGGTPMGDGQIDGEINGPSSYEAWRRGIIDKNRKAVFERENKDKELNRKVDPHHFKDPEVLLDGQDDAFLYEWLKIQKADFGPMKETKSLDDRINNFLK